MDNNYVIDSDDEDEENKYNDDNGISTEEIFDPERSERINRMMEASQKSTFDVLQDDQVTDFVLRMAEKNQRDEEIMNRDDLEESYNSNSMSQRRRQLHQEQQQHRSPDEYPPGEAYAGDEIGEEGDIPSYDPKDESVLSYGRLCCVACGLVIVMIATSVIILLFVVLLDDEEHSKNKSAFDGMILPVAPSNLKEVCALDNLSGMQGEIDCRDPCMKAACCWEQQSDGRDPACWESHPLECAPYESCVHLLQAGSGSRPQEARPTSTVPRAPDGVASCDPNTIDNVDEVLACEDACSYGTCCWKTGASLCVTDPNCLAYSPCLILNTGGAAGSGSTAVATTPPVAIPDAPGNLVEVCGQSTTQQDCREICHTATCCWKMAVSTFTGKDGGTITESVLGECATRSECAAYKPCQSLNWSSEDPGDSESGPATTHVVPKAPSNLAEVCDPTAGEVDAYEICKETCHAAACCWKTSTTTYTGTQGEQISETMQGACSFNEECGGYESCKTLPGGSTNVADGTTTVAPAYAIPQPPDNLLQICTEQSVETCREVCNQALCCWKMATVTHTDANGDTVTEAIRGSCSAYEECLPYKACLDLPEATTSGANTIADAPADLETICNPPADQMDSIQACAESCHEATCCWKTATITYEDANNETLTSSVPGSCSHKAECAPYKPCSALEEDVLSPSNPAVSSTTAPVSTPATTPASSPTGGNIDYTESMIYDACFNHVNQPNQEKTLCEITCEAGACCYEPGQTCEDGFECTKYEPCNKLIEDADASNTQPTAVEVACQNTEDLADCVSLCSEVTCCFTQNLAKSCDVVAPGTICSEYTACEVIYEGNGR